MRIKFLRENGESIVLDNVIYFSVEGDMASFHTTEGIAHDEVWVSDVNALTKEQSAELNNLSYRAMVMGFADLTKTGVPFREG